MKHTERAVKMTDMPRSFGFTLLIHQTAKKIMVELTNFFFFLLEFTILLLHFAFQIIIQEKKTIKTNQIHTKIQSS